MDNNPSSKEVLVLGNPTMPNEPVTLGDSSRPLKPLPGAEREAKAIASLLETIPIIGDEATKIAVTEKMLQARIIHLATHAYFNDRRGLDSAIALAPSDKDRGYLTAAEIFQMKLNAELVVLSACNTGRGRIPTRRRCGRTGEIAHCCWSF